MFFLTKTPNPIKTLSVQRREAWIDNVKMVAMLFVMLGHTWRIVHCPLPDWLSLFILSFNMPLFVILTGYSSIRSIDKIERAAALRDYVFKITTRIMLPSAVSSMVLTVVIILLRFLMTGEMHLKRFLYLSSLIMLISFYIISFIARKGEIGRIFFNLLCYLSIPYGLYFSSFWFLSMIWCVCLSVAAASYIFKKFNIGNFLKTVIGWSSPLEYLLLYFISFVISWILDVVYIKTSDFVHFFLIGYAMAKFSMISFVYRFPKNCFWVFVFLFLGLFIVYILGENTMNFWINHFYNMVIKGDGMLYLLRIFASTLICFSFIIAVKTASKNYGLFSFWGSQTLALYIVHGSIIAVCFELPFTYDIYGVYYLLYAIPMTFVIFALSIGIIELLTKSDITMAYCLGKISKS